MIPIRNFPYTDYHDLNLDFLLRQFQIYEVDIEELKRRVKALEDWRTNTVDPDLRDIKLTIIDIQGDIRSLGDRVTIVEGDIVTVKGNITTLAANSKNYIIESSGVTDLKIYDGYPNGTQITDMYSLMKDICQSLNSTLGQKNINFYFKEANILYRVIYDVYYIGPTYLEIRLFGAYPRSAGNPDFMLFGRFIRINNDNTVNVTKSQTSGSLVKTGGTLHVTANTPFESNTDPDTNTDYPYYVEVSHPSVMSYSHVNAYFSSFKSFLDYSDVLSDYIVTDTDSIKFFFTRTLTGAEEFTLQYDFIGGLQ